MFILSLIAIVLLALFIYMFIEWFNGYSQKTGNYRFFSFEHSIAYIAAYLCIFFGKNLMTSHWMGDPLNGGILLVIGITILIVTILNNFKRTNRSLAIKGSLAQLILYVPITAVAVILLAAAVAFFSQTKPVYTINDRD